MSNFIELECKAPIFEPDQVGKLFVSGWEDGWIYLNVDKLVAIRKNTEFAGVWNLDLGWGVYYVDVTAKDALVSRLEALNWKVM